MPKKSCRLAIDVGGTFTDVVLVDDESFTVWFAKVLSTPDDPSRGSLTGASEILDGARITASAVIDVVHATTVATNAVLEGKGAQTALVTTRGFRDALEMGREARYDIYDLGIRMPPPLVPRRHRAEVNERISFDGDILTPLDESDVAGVLNNLIKDTGVQSLAISLLHGYAHPEHERQVASIASKLFPDLTISVSHQVSAEIREFERTSTTVVDAYVKPLVQSYVGRLNTGIKDLGMRNEASMMLSHGGIGLASDVANTYPVRMIESGPAAGAIAAAHFAREALDRPDAVAFDMGGTTAKISLIQAGQPEITHEYEVGHVHRFKRGSGYPLQISAIEMLEIGAGGGSIAHVNELGLLNVGPESAGAVPGPACYGRGGLRPTVTDADLLLGYLDPEHFLGGDMMLDLEAVKEAIQNIANTLDMQVEQVAWGIHDVVNESMAAAIRAHSAEKGIDLRNFAMIAFGGAGPVHAYALARKLGIKQLLCPFGAGVASAIGCLAAVPAVEQVVSHFSLLGKTDLSQINDQFAGMRKLGEASMAKLIGSSSDLEMLRSIDMRCQGQGYSVTVPMDDNSQDDGSMNADSGTRIFIPALQSRFNSIYENVYGHLPPDVPLEIIGLRARVLQPRPKLKIVRASRDDRQQSTPSFKGTRSVYFEVAGGYTETAIYDRYGLEPGKQYAGPAIIEERETSIVTGPDTNFHIDQSSNIVIDFKE
jgi:N-methylhydantoinase A